jgi:hypothetical protein
MCVHGQMAILGLYMARRKLHTKIPTSIYSYLYTAIYFPEQSGKVEYERERMLGIANKFINF